MGAGVRFCPNCGTAAGVEAAPSMSPVGAPFAPQKNQNWPWIIGGLAALALAVIGMGAAGLLKFGQDARSNLAEKGALGNDSLAAQASISDSLRQKGEATTDLQAPGSRNEMPQDVYDWLKHLEKCEKRKEKITRDQMNSLMVSINRGSGVGGLTPGDVQALTDPDAANDKLPSGLNAIFEEIAKMGKDWKDLKEFFDSKPPPEECKPIASAYDTGLNGFLDSFAMVSGHTNRFANPENGMGDSEAKQAIPGLQDLKKNHVQAVDNPLQVTDDLVEAICKKYGVMKWFRIDAKGPSPGSLGGFGSMPGLGG